MDERIDLALNVLSRALEENQFSEELWLRYLGVFSRRRQQDDGELLVMCKQALELAPSYQLHWKVSRLPAACHPHSMHARVLKTSMTCRLYMCRERAIS